MTSHAILREVADRRIKLHENHKSHRPLSTDYEYIGLVGEDEFATKYGLDIDLTDRVAGDNNVDFWHWFGSIDVKTARKPYNLLVEIGKKSANVLVLAGYDAETDSAELIGWAHDKEILNAPVKDFGYGVINHYIPADKLHPMKELAELMERD